jgi:hypothetical protein
MRQALCIGCAQMGNELVGHFFHSEKLSDIHGGASNSRSHRVGFDSSRPPYRHNQLQLTCRQHENAGLPTRSTPRNAKSPGERQGFQSEAAGEAMVSETTQSSHPLAVGIFENLILGALMPAS